MDKTDHFLEDTMKQFKLLAILVPLLVVTACHVHTVFDHGQSGQGIHSEVTHSLSPKAVPDRYRFEPIHDLTLQADSAILINAGSGEVLYEKNSNESKGVASMSKIMSELLVLEAIDAGTLDWNDSVAISDYAYKISHQPGLSSIELQQDQSYSVQELFHAMAVTSANGATIALAEKVAGSEKEFIMLMNEKAEKIELHDANFVNSTGLTNHDLQGYHSAGTINDYNEMSAKDLATLTRSIIQQYPDLLEVTKLTEFTVQKEAYNSSNWMLPGTEKNFLNIDVTFPGVDGLKTGYTSDAGYGFTGTVQIDGSRFISVVIGAEEIGDRFVETGKLYDAILEQLKEKES